ncbi:MAG: hypothetical protein PF441_05415 [Desulfuromusa sp.]|jgi:hypothetical protein|nr:hypothetical protein [Desulfuromusa sp.]
MKLFFIILIPLFLTSCAVLYPQPKQAVLLDQQNFSLAFDEFQESHRLDSLQKLKEDFPNSVWAARAETIILYSQELDQRKAQNENLRESARVQTLELEQRKAQNENLRESERVLTLELEQLKKLNQQLTEQIEQLTSLLIELEKHPK